MEVSIELLGIAAGAIAIVWAALCAAITALWFRLRDKDKTISTLVKDHRKEMNACTRERIKVYDNYVDLLKDFAESFQADDEEEDE